MNILTASRKQLESWTPPCPYALFSFRDPGTPSVNPPAPCRLVHETVCHDIAGDMADLRGPRHGDAHDVAMAFKMALEYGWPLIICQCEAGVGRSVATAAAFMEYLRNPNAKKLTRIGTHNRKLHAMLLHELGLPPVKEPLVALSVRIKYPLDRMAAFAYSLDRQRYPNWKAVCVADGPLDQSASDYAFAFRKGLELIEAPERRGLWGHPWRQLGIDRCLELGAEYIGLSNDDNYYTPGYFEQMVNALTDNDADFVSCQMLHSYIGWSVAGSAPVAGLADVGNWLASADLIRACPWDGTDFFADGRYVERLAALARKAVRVERPLFVKN